MYYVYDSKLKDKDHRHTFLSPRKIIYMLRVLIKWKTNSTNLERSSSSFSFAVCDGWASSACSGANSATSASAWWDFLKPGIDGIAGIDTVGMVGIETDGIETVGREEGSHPDTFPVTFENIPPDALVGLYTQQRVGKKSIKKIAM